MIRIFIISLLLIVGCVMPDRNQYTEGTSLTLGLYVPLNGSVYGLQCVNYLSGKRIIMTTNQTFAVESETSITNNSFGVFEVNEISKTKIGETDDKHKD